MPTQDRVKYLAELQKLGLKRLSADLSRLLVDFRRLLMEAHREAMLIDEKERGSAAYGAEVLLDGTADIPNKLALAIAERDPSKLYYAASNLGYVPRAASDMYPFSWFSKGREFEEVLVQLLDTEAAITHSINIFDPASLESARKELS